MTRFRFHHALRLSCATALAATLAACAIGRFDPEDPRHGPTLERAAAALADEAHRQVRLHGTARRDGYVYALDLAPLMLHAAQRGDAAFYLRLRTDAERLIWRRRDDAETRGFVLWRYRPDTPPEVSGASEMLWLSRALWAGSRAFDRPADRVLVQEIIEGYRRHAIGDGDDWHVRKYYAFGGRSYASHSVLAAYHPDFLAALDAEIPGRGYGDLARRSLALLERARARSGLLLPLIQPGFGPVLPGLPLARSAPDGIVSLAESCEAAESVLRARPRSADDVLEVIEDDDAWSGVLPFGYFDHADGEPRGLQPLSYHGYACLAQLAGHRGRGGARRRLEPQLRRITWELASLPSAQEAPLYLAGPLLLAAEALGAFSAPKTERR